MKLINKLLIASLCLGMLTLASCNNGDDEGPSEPPFMGNLSGTLTDIEAGGAETQFVATSIEATHDTTAFANEAAVKIIAKNAAGVEIVINLRDTVATMVPYTFTSTSTNTSTITFSPTKGPFTTVRDDIGATASGNIEITDNGMDDGILRGIIHILGWYEVVQSGEDNIKAFLQNGSFEVPLTRTGFSIGGGDATLSCKINGAQFDPALVMSSGFSITASSLTGQGIGLILPTNATVGQHNFGGEYSAIYTSGMATYTTEGTINISAVNAAQSSASGTFQFTATPIGGGETVSVTDGTFSF